MRPINRNGYYLGGKMKEGKRWWVVRKPDGRVVMWDLYHCACDYILVDCITGTVIPNAFKDDIQPVIDSVNVYTGSQTPLDMSV